MQSPMVEGWVGQCQPPWYALGDRDRMVGALGLDWIGEGSETGSANGSNAYLEHSMRVLPIL